MRISLYNSIKTIKNLFVQSSAAFQPPRDNYAMRVTPHNYITVGNSALTKCQRIS